LNFFISKEKFEKNNEKKLFEVTNLKLFDKDNKRLAKKCETLKKYYEKAINMKEDDCIQLIDSQNQQKNSDPVYLLIKTKKWSSIYTIRIVEIVNEQLQIKTADQIIEEANIFFQE
jgi:hypothetical protein